MSENEVGGDKLASIIAKAEAKAVEAVARAKAEKEGKPLPARKRAPKKSVTKQPPREAAVAFTAEDICPDERSFLVRTRSTNLHSHEMKRLFWANGGETLIERGLTYAQAFDILRREKQNALTQK